MASAKTKALTGMITLNLDRKPEVRAGVESLLAAAATLEVVDEQSDAVAAEIVSRCAAEIKAIEEDFKDSKNTTNQAHKSICALEKKYAQPYIDARLALEMKIIPYRKRIRDERNKLQSEVDLTANAEQKQLLDKAEQLRSQGKMTQAKAVEEEANSIIVPVLPSVGVSDDAPLTEREPWVGKVVSIMDVIHLIQSGKQPLMHAIKVRGKDVLQELPILEINPLVLAHLAKTHMDTLKVHFPGLDAEQDLQLAARKR